MVTAQQVFLVSQKKEVTGKEAVAIELDMPPEEFWKMQEMTREAEYLLANGNEPLKVVDINRKILKMAMPHAVSEKDRVWIQDKLGIAH